MSGKSTETSGREPSGNDVEKRKLTKWERLIPTVVWLLRIAVGGVFVMSGLVKAIDIWGFVYKIEEYLAVWQMPMWRSVTIVGALGIAATEFVSGMMMLTGSFRRYIAQFMMAIMAVMLPLTFYVMTRNPVADCGCFGDFWVISNDATFYKNLAITAALAFLIKYNMRAGALISPYVQWIPLTLCSAYIILIGLIGYNIQPLIDFRSFPIGEALLADRDEEDEDDGTDLIFVYEKDGVMRDFTIDALPDSSWSFVERRENSRASDAPTEFVVISDGYDIAPDIISEQGDEYLLVITDINRADISFTLALNELNDRATAAGGSFIGLIAAGDSSDIDYWQDISMAKYPMYTAEPTLLKELSRGVMSLVKLHDGHIEWKRTVGSLSIDSRPDAEPDGLMAPLLLHGPKVVALLSLLLVGAIVIVAFPSLFFRNKVNKNN